jgi:hypothetical protein
MVRETKLEKIRVAIKALTRPDAEFSGMTTKLLLTDERKWVRQLLT